MASVGTYLNFNGNAEEVMNFYAGVFETEIMSIMRYGEFQGEDDGSGQEMPESALDKIMNVQMLILGGHLLQASDHIPEFGGPLSFGTNMHIVLMTDSRAETDALYARLLAGGEQRQPPADMGFGYYAEGADKFGTNWMFYNTPE